MLDMLVRETIHHGDYYNVREQEIDPTWDGFVELLLASPYKGSSTAENLARNKYVAKAFADLLTKGEAEHGWASYQNLTEV